MKNESKGIVFATPFTCRTTFKTRLLFPLLNRFCVSNLFHKTKPPYFCFKESFILKDHFIGVHPHSISRQAHPMACAMSRPHHLPVDGMYPDRSNQRTQHICVSVCVCVYVCVCVCMHSHTYICVYTHTQRTHTQHPENSL